MRIEQTVEIAASPEQVWSVMIDVMQWPQWTRSVTSVELLDPPPLAVGSRARIRQPRLPTAVWTVTAVEPGRYFEWRSVAPGVTSIGGHRVDSIAGDRARVFLSLEWTGLLAPVINLIYGGLSRRYVATEAAGLKRRCESGPS